VALPTTVLGYLPALEKGFRPPQQIPTDLNLGGDAMENIVLLIIALIVLERIFNGARMGK